MNELQVSGLYTYPIKSCKGVSLTSAAIGRRGLLHDRRWMLVDQKNRFISQRELSNLSKIAVKIHDHSLEVSFEVDQIIIPFLSDEEIKTLPEESVLIWGDICSAIACNDTINSWFTDKLGKPCRLVFMPEQSLRPVDPAFAPEGQITAFSDGYPILILGQSSLHLLNEQLEIPISINRFRPNIVFTGGPPHIEDTFRKFRIKSVQLECVKLSRRCNVPNIDQETSIPSAEPTKTLTGYRLFDNRILFGNNTLVHSHGIIEVGDVIHLES